MWLFAVVTFTSPKAVCSCDDDSFASCSPGVQPADDAESDDADGDWAEENSPGEAGRGGDGSWVPEEEACRGARCPVVACVESCWKFAVVNGLGLEETRVGGAWIGGGNPMLPLIEGMLRWTGDRTLENAVDGEVGRLLFGNTPAREVEFAPAACGTAEWFCAPSDSSACTCAAIRSVFDQGTDSPTPRSISGVALDVEDAGLLFGRKPNRDTSSCPTDGHLG